MMQIESLKPQLFTGLGIEAGYCSICQEYLSIMHVKRMANDTTENRRGESAVVWSRSMIYYQLIRV
jgi:hypothetical protein